MDYKIIQNNWICIQYEIVHTKLQYQSTEWKKYLTFCILYLLWTTLHIIYECPTSLYICRYRFLHTYMYLHYMLCVFLHDVCMCQCIYIEYRKGKTVFVVRFTWNMQLLNKIHIRQSISFQLSSNNDTFSSYSLSERKIIQCFWFQESIPGNFNPIFTTQKYANQNCPTTSYIHERNIKCLTAFFFCVYSNFICKYIFSHIDIYYIIILS